MRPPPGEVTDFLRRLASVDVSVIVPVKDDPRIFECVDSIRAAACERAVEIIVVDNQSSAEFSASLDALAEHGVRVVAAGGTVYAARNRGCEAACGAALLFTDADCKVDSEWIANAVALLRRGADIVQGLAGSAGDTFRDRLIQARYEAPFRAMRPGTPVLCDTRNMGARRAVLDRVRFEEAYRRVGDTEFGLRAEAAGFRVAFAPEMRVDHQHESALDVFVAKQVCHGWGAARLMHDSPGLPWHGGHLLVTATWLPRARRLPLHGMAGRLIGRVSIVGARALDRAATRLPFRVALFALGALDKGAGLAGHLTYRRGGLEPSPSDLLGRRLPRD